MGLEPGFAGTSLERRAIEDSLTLEFTVLGFMLGSTANSGALLTPLSKEYLCTALHGDRGNVKDVKLSFLFSSMCLFLFLCSIRVLSLTGTSLLLQR